MISHEHTQPHSISIEYATDADSLCITDVFVNARAGMEYIDPNLHSHEETLEWIKSLIADKENTVLKAVLDNTLEGFCVLRDGWLEHLYVSPESQGKNIGSRLLHEAQSTNSELQLWVFQKNTKAIRFYERNGFVLEETTDGSRNEEKVPDARYKWVQFAE